MSTTEPTDTDRPSHRRHRLPASLPPRGLSLEQAAEYVGLSVPSFLVEIEAGRYPPSLRCESRRKVWDRCALDHAMDRMSGLLPAPEGHGALGAASYDTHRENLRAAIARRKAG